MNEKDNGINVVDSVILRKDEYEIEDLSLKTYNIEPENKGLKITEKQAMIIKKIDNIVCDISKEIEKISCYGVKLAEIKESYRLKEKYLIKE